MRRTDYQICSRCVMDTSDPKISFNQDGMCNHCENFDDTTSKRWFPNSEGVEKLKNIVKKIKNEGKNQDYDCILGLSGGVDSSYLALIMKEHDLRPLVVHVDAGWNSEIAVSNIEKIVDYCGYDLHTHVMDWGEVQDLQLAYLKAGVANQDVVQDHAFFASIYHFAVKNKIKFVLSGGNIATESVFPTGWHHSAMDAINLKAIHRRFGKIKLREYKTISFLKYYFYYPFIRGMTVIRPLNYVFYDKSEALKILEEKVGFKNYGRKHGESRFTRFFQNHFLPVKFNIDKRRAHLSSQILSSQITRAEALRQLIQPLYNEAELTEDKAYIARKLGISVEFLDSLTNAPGHSYSEYANWDLRYRFMVRIKTSLKKIPGIDAKSYS